MSYSGVYSQRDQAIFLTTKLYYNRLERKIFFHNLSFITRFIIFYESRGRGKAEIQYIKLKASLLGKIVYVFTFEISCVKFSSQLLKNEQ